MADNRPIPRTISEDQLRLMLDHIARGHDYATVGKLIGLTLNQVRWAATSPQFQAALRLKISAELLTDAAVSRRLLRKVVIDRKSATKDRIQAARILTGLGGFVPPKAAEQGKAPTSPAEMTSEQLRSQVEEIERELSQRAEPVTPSETQLVDMLS